MIKEVLICDICGDEYLDNTEIVVGSMEIYLRAVQKGKLINNMGKSTDTRMDICPNCSKQIQELLDHLVCGEWLPGAEDRDEKPCDEICDVNNPLICKRCQFKKPLFCNVDDPHERI